MTDPVTDVYRSPTAARDRLSEDEAIAALLARSTRLRGRLLIPTISGAAGGGAAALLAYLALSPTISGRLAGAIFALGAVAAFRALRVLTKLFVLARERAWVTAVAREHDLRPAALLEALAILDS